MENITVVDFSDGKANKTVTNAPYQWSYGQILRITGLELPDGIEIHFSLSEKVGIAYRVPGAKTEEGIEVKIPQFIFENEGTRRESYKGYVFIYPSDPDSGETTHKIILNIKTRPKPDDYIYSDEEFETYKSLEKRISSLEDADAPVVQSDWNESDESNPGYVKNRPFYEETIVTRISSIEWDGNTEGLISVANSMSKCYKISDIVPTDAQILGGTIQYSDESSRLISLDGNIQEKYNRTTNGSYVGMDPDFVVVREPGDITILAGSGTYNFTETGTWVGSTSELRKLSFSEDVAVSSIAIKKLDEKFIPGAIARTDDFTVLPIEQITDFGAEIVTSIEDSSTAIEDHGGLSYRRDIYLKADMINPTNYIFNCSIPDGYAAAKVWIQFIGLNGRKHTVSVFPYARTNLLFHVYNDKKQERLVLYEIYYGDSYEISYDENGNFVSLAKTKNITSDNLLSTINSKTKSESYAPTDDTDIAVKKYVDEKTTSWNDLTDRPFCETTDIIPKIIFHEFMISITPNPLIELVEGSEYIVTCNEVEYRCVATKIVCSTMRVGVGLGNLGRIHYYNDEMDYPFAIEYDPKERTPTYTLYSVTDSDTTSIRVSTSEGSKIIVPLPEKFIPDTIATKKYVDEKNTVFAGATSETAGEHGLVPAPNAGYENAVLLGDGTWVPQTINVVISQTEDGYSSNLDFETVAKYITGMRPIKVRFGTRVYDLANNAENSITFHCDFGGSYDCFTFTKAGKITRDRSDIVLSSRKVNGKSLSTDVTLTAEDVEAEPEGTADAKVSAHNTSDTAHNDIRLLIKNLTSKVTTLLDSDDETLDQTSEIVAYIKSNKSLIDAITTSKISVSDIVDNLTTNVKNKPLSSAQGVVLKDLIDDIQTALTKITVPTKLPNPNKLIFEGAVSAEYDGSEAVTVNIPSMEDITNLIDSRLEAIENGSY